MVEDHQRSISWLDSFLTWKNPKSLWDLNPQWWGAGVSKSTTLTTWLWMPLCTVCICETIAHIVLMSRYYSNVCILTRMLLLLTSYHLYPHCCRFKSQWWLWILSCEEVIQLANETLVVLGWCLQAPEIMHS